MFTITRYFRETLYDLRSDRPGQAMPREGLLVGKIGHTERDLHDIPNSKAICGQHLYIRNRVLSDYRT